MAHLDAGDGEHAGGHRPDDEHDDPGPGERERLAEGEEPLARERRGRGRPGAALQVAHRTDSGGPDAGTARVRPLNGACGSRARPGRSGDEVHARAAVRAAGGLRPLAEGEVAGAGVTSEEAIHGRYSSNARRRSSIGCLGNR